MRKPKKKEPANTDRRTSTSDGVELTQDTRHYRFLTYVMGGGVKVDGHNKYADERTPIRAASIRGQLRFWWRACNPQNCKTIEELRKKEALIWGSAEKPSSVVVKVAKQAAAPIPCSIYHYKPTLDKKSGQMVPRLRSIEKGDPIAYGAFSLQPVSEAQNQTPPAAPGVLHNYQKHEFELIVRYNKALAKDIEWALWAWETFGGLGARTRRGFGAIERADKSSKTIAENLEKLHMLRSNPPIDGVPSLVGARLEVAAQNFVNPLKAWEHCLQILQSLRQGLGIGRNPPSPGSQSPAGRSRWPEPEEIRRLTEQRSSRHQKLPKQVDRFPRAAFGLPIIFQFQGGATKLADSNKDPIKTELKPLNADRMASPLILRPIRDGDGYRAMALVLHAKMPEQIELSATGKEKSNFNKKVQVGLDRGQAAQIDPLKLDGRVFTNPLDRFLEEFKK